LSRLGDDVVLPQRPIHVTTDMSSEHVLIAYNEPSAVSVHRLLPDGRVGTAVRQPRDLDTGIYAHEIRIVPSNQVAVVVARGNDPAAGQSEDPGALKVFKYQGGVLMNSHSVAPGGGLGFGPRNVELDPFNNRIYVSLERQNKLATLGFDGATITAEPLYQCDTLENPGDVRPMQRAGAVQVHPTGRFVYVANRAFGAIEDDGQPVFAGGENTIVVYEVDGRSGEPRRIQSIDTQGICPRTFSMDASGRVLIVGNSRPMLVRSGSSITMTPANLSLFAVAADGRLRHERSYAVDRGGEQLFWSGSV